MGETVCGAALLKNLLMMISVALIVLGVVTIVKHRKPRELVYTPAFDAGAPFDSQPKGIYDGEYILSSVKCPDKGNKEVKVPEAKAIKVAIRGMMAKLTRQAGRCEIVQTLQLAPSPGSAPTGNIRVVQLKQDRVDCAPDCPCHATITGVVQAVFDLDQKVIHIPERTRAEKEFCDGKLPMTFKYTASAK